MMRCPSGVPRASSRKYEWSPSLAGGSAFGQLPQHHRAAVALDEMPLPVDAQGRAEAHHVAEERRRRIGIGHGQYIAVP